MNRNVIFILILFISLDSFGQIARDKVILSLDGNYMKTNTVGGVSTNTAGTKGQYLDLGSSVGLFLSDHFVMGIMLHYNWAEEKRTNELILGNNYLQIEEMDIKSRILLPGVFLGYYVPILNKFYFNAELSLNCGRINSDYKTLRAVRTTYFTTDSAYIYIGNDPVSGGFSKSSGSGYFSAQILPGLTYFLSPKFAMNLGLGGLEYSITDWKLENSACAVNFNPGYWKLGIKLIL